MDEVKRNDSGDKVGCEKRRKKEIGNVKGMRQKSGNEK